MLLSSHAAAGRGSDPVLVRAFAEAAGVEGVAGLAHEQRAAARRSAVPLIRDRTGPVAVADEVAWCCARWSGWAAAKPRGGVADDYFVSEVAVQEPFETVTL